MVVQTILPPSNSTSAAQLSMDHVSPSDGAKISAAELLGKSIGLFKQVQVQEVSQRSPEELRTELEKRLIALGLIPDPGNEVALVFVSINSVRSTDISTC